MITTNLKGRVYALLNHTGRDFTDYHKPLILFEIDGQRIIGSHNCNILIIGGMEGPGFMDLDGDTAIVWDNVKVLLTPEGFFDGFEGTGRIPMTQIPVSVSTISRMPIGPGGHQTAMIEFTVG